MLFSADEHSRFRTKVSLFGSSFVSPGAFDSVSANGALEAVVERRTQKDVTSVKFRFWAEVSSWTSAILMAIVTIIAGMHGKVLSSAPTNSKDINSFVSEIRASKKFNKLMAVLAALAVAVNTLGEMASGTSEEYTRSADELQKEIIDIRRKLDDPKITHLVAQELIDRLNRLAIK